MAKRTYRKVGKLGITVPKNFIWPRDPAVFFDLTGSRVVIEEGVTFASGVYVWTHDHYYNKSNWRDLPFTTTKKPTVFKKFCFVGVNSIILSKCKYIGKYSVIGAGSVVTKNIPDFEIWAGNPAKKIGEVKLVKDK